MILLRLYLNLKFKNILPLKIHKKYLVNAIFVFYRNVLSIIFPYTHRKYC